MIVHKDPTGESWSDPQALFEAWGYEISDRKIRLFAIACCRMLGMFLSSAQQYALYAAEKYADGLATDDDLEKGLKWVLSEYTDQAPTEEESANGSLTEAVLAALYTEKLINWYVTPAGFDGSRRITPYAPEAFQVRHHYALYTSIHAAQALSSTMLKGHVTSEQREGLLAFVFNEHASYLRDLIGNPRRVKSKEIARIARENPHIRLLAEEIYRDSLFFYIPVLEQELIKNGIDPSLIGGGQGHRTRHVKGCWLLDEVLGMS